MAITKRTFYLATDTHSDLSAVKPEWSCWSVAKAALSCKDALKSTLQWGAWVLLLTAASGQLEASTAMPWEGPICAVAGSLKDQVAVMLSVVATIMIGIMFMYSETGGIVARIGGWLLGLSCALSVASIITALFPGVSIPGCL